MFATLMNVSRVKPVRCTRLNETKRRAVRRNENVVFQIEMNQIIQRLETIDLLATTFPIEKPFAVTVFDLDVGDFVRRFHADDVIARYRFRISDEKNSNLITGVENRFGLRVRDGSVVVPGEEAHRGEGKRENETHFSSVGI